MIFWDGVNIFPHVSTEYSSAISNICYIAHLVYNQDYNCTASTPLDRILRFGKGKKLMFCFFEAKF